MRDTVRTLVLRSAGTNCDEETAHAFELAGSDVERVHVGAFLRRERKLDEFDILAFPGGFSYGDDLGAGTVLANRLRSRLAGELEELVASGRLVIGICNGFQVLVRLGLLPGWEGEKAASLVENASGKFEDRWVTLRVDSEACPFLRGPPEGSGRLGKGRLIRLPVAHKEGRFLLRDAAALERLRAQGQVALTYVDPATEGAGAQGRPAGYPRNPNGSVEGVAGIASPGGNVLGLMPHPER
ncbi:MAG: phosphoribosylformylglycinamidine synthase I, partial [Planctomycetes bacterium]|nr:phosphoribosylformylglycinamidine synthase I [Planctomycetota bacterium]